MTKGPSTIIAATKAVDLADRAMVTKHRMRLRAAYRAALLEILGPGSYEEIDLKCEDLLDSMVSNMTDRTLPLPAPSEPGDAGIKAIEEALKTKPGAAPFPSR